MSIWRIRMRDTVVFTLAVPGVVLVLPFVAYWIVRAWLAGKDE